MAETAAAVTATQPPGISAASISSCPTPYPASDTTHGSTARSSPTAEASTPSPHPTHTRASGCATQPDHPPPPHPPAASTRLHARPPSECSLRTATPPTQGPAAATPRPRARSPTGCRRSRPPPHSRCRTRPLRWHPAPRRRTTCRMQAAEAEMAVAVTAVAVTMVTEVAGMGREAAVMEMVVAGTDPVAVVTEKEVAEMEVAAVVAKRAAARSPDRSTASPSPLHAAMSWTPASVQQASTQRPRSSPRSRALLSPPAARQ